MKQTISILLAFFTCAAAFAGEPAYVSKYAGQEARRIKTLSADDIEQLTAGKGWGLAKAAELNGIPGPAHILEMKDRISLTGEQEKKIRLAYEAMNKNARLLGSHLIRLEAQLNDYFVKRKFSKFTLDEKLTEIALVTKKLRYAHLKAHIDMLKILSEDQISLYNQLRGYSSGDPCNNIPAGHDAVMWKKHNGCK